MTDTTLEEKYPEHAKLKGLEGKNDVVGDFLTWMTSKYVICEYHQHTKDCRFAGSLECGYQNGDAQPIHKNVEWFISQYFKIDPNKLDDEKRAMLEEIRNNNGN